MVYLHECAASNDVVGEDEIPKGRNDQSAKQTVHAELPCLLALAGSCIDTGHQEYNVEGGEGVEDLAASVRVHELRCAMHRTLSVKFQVCSASLVALEVKMSR